MFRYSAWIFTMLITILLTACGPRAEQSFNAPVQPDTTSYAGEPADPIDVTEGDYIDDSGQATPVGGEERAAQQAQSATATSTSESAEATTPTPDSTEAVTATPTPDSADEANTTPEATTTAISAETLVDNGEAHFSANCVACHQSDGQGVGDTYPALDGNEFVTQEEAEPAIDIVLTGRGAMPSFQDEFSDQDVAEVLSYVRNAWSNDAPVVRPGTVEDVRAEVGSPREPADTDQ